MHRVRLNAASMDLTIIPCSPLLVQSGGIPLDPSLPDMQFVRTFTADRGEVIYIPGTSLKGVVRSYVEKSLRTIRGEGKEGACHTFGEKSCAEELKKLGEELPSYQVYKESCRACKIFGNTRLKGRICFADAYPVGEVRTEVRHGVAISRMSHAVAQGPFDIEVVILGEFNTRVFLENFELWQLGLITLSLEGFSKGLVRIGFGKNRGFGEVKVRVNKVEFFFSRKPAPLEIWGVGKLLPPGQEMENYGFREDDFLTIGSTAEEEQEEVYGVRRTYGAQAWENIKYTCLQQLKEILK